MTAAFHSSRRYLAEYASLVSRLAICSTVGQVWAITERLDEIDALLERSQGEAMTTHLASLPTPDHLDLESLIARLKAEPDHVVEVGFAEAHSYRGYYEDLAFEITGPTTVDHLLAVAEGALGVTFGGWKGGDYTMRGHTSVWLVRSEGECGESLGAVLLELLLANVSPMRASVKGHTAHITGTVHGTVVQAGNIDGGLRL